jgi:hypothetical protein
MHEQSTRTQPHRQLRLQKLLQISATCTDLLLFWIIMLHIAIPLIMIFALMTMGNSLLLDLCTVLIGVLVFIGAYKVQHASPLSFVQDVHRQAKKIQLAFGNLPFATFSRLLKNVCITPTLMLGIAFFSLLLATSPSFHIAILASTILALVPLFLCSLSAYHSFKMAAYSLL